MVSNGVALVLIGFTFIYGNECFCGYNYGSKLMGC